MLEAGNIYQVKITLKSIRPPIWRRVQIPSKITLGDLHEVIQATMGWGDIHLHCFNSEDGREFSRKHHDVDLEPGSYDELKTPLTSVLRKAGAKLQYTYDFGDNWEHTILLEKVLPTDVELTHPRIIAGRNACPPEDCGGPYRYAHLLRSMSREAEGGCFESDDVPDFLASDFDPEEFDVALANRMLMHWAPKRGGIGDSFSLRP